MRIDFQAIKTIALSNVVEPTDESFYRFICRWFSKTFSTPLMDVYKLDPYIVCLHFFESRLEGMEEEQLELEIKRSVDPDFDEKEEESLKDFIEQVEKEAKDKQKPKNSSPKVVEKKFDLQDEEEDLEEIDFP